MLRACSSHPEAQIQQLRALLSVLLGEFYPKESILGLGQSDKLLYNHTYI